MVNDVIIPFEMPIIRNLSDGIFTFFGIIDRNIVIRVSAAFRYAATSRHGVFHMVASEILPEQDGPIGTISREGGHRIGAQEYQDENKHGDTTPIHYSVGK